MILNQHNLNALFNGFRTVFNDAFRAAPTYYAEIASIVNSDSRDETYGWLGEFPSLREWIGDRHIKSLAAHSYNIRNKKFELTFSVSREDIEDDKYGTFSPLIGEMAYAAAGHPDELIFQILNNGFAEKGYDGVPFFSDAHPIEMNDSTAGTASNVTAGSGPAWYLLDASRPLRPLIFQKRVDYSFDRLDQPNDENVFRRDELMFGIRARCSAGFGLWQFAHGSKADLTPANYAAARAAMRGLRGRGGRPMGIKPTHLVVPPALEEAAQQIVAGATKLVEAADGTPVTSVSNTWVGSAKVIVSEWLAA